MKPLCNPRHCLAIGLVLSLLGAEGAVAGTVTNANNSGTGSLRQAVSDAAFGETITFAPGLNGQTISLTSGELAIGRSLTIDASGLANGITLSGNNVSRIFHNSGASLTLIRLTLTHGNAGGNNGTLGGAIFNFGTVIATNCVLTGNTAASGGAIYNSGGPVNLTNCTVSGNAASGGGGGILNTGTVSVLTITTCTVAGNTASLGGAIRNSDGGTVTIGSSTLSGNTVSTGGGAIFNSYSGTGSNSASMTMDRCTLSGNSASIGAAIYNQGIATLRVSTIATNTATTLGGGVFNDSGPMTLTDCTVSANTAPAGKGGGLVANDFVPLTTSTTVRNCIIAGNGASDVDLIALGGPPVNSFTSSGGNLIGTGNATGNFAAAGDTRGNTAADIKLAALGDYGGPTRTMYPMPGSPAIDPAAGATSSSFATDQRGLARVSDGDNDGGARVDIGAVEAAATSQWVVTTAANSGLGSLRQAITDTIYRGEISFAPALSGQTITLSSVIAMAGKDIAIDAGSLPGGLTISGGGTTRIFHVASGSTLALNALKLTGASDSAVRNDGTLTITNSTLSGNTTPFYGGAVANRNILTITKSTLSGNSAEFGGAIFNSRIAGSNPSATLTLCTLAGNSATDSGGAIQHDEGVVTLTDCTVSGNTAAAGVGGGVSTANFSGTVVVRNSIIAGNAHGDVELWIDPSNLGATAGSAFTSQGSNLIGTGSETGVFTEPGDSFDNTAADIKLAPLAHYGGLTQTMHPLPGSPALDPVGGAALSLFPTDQRGRARVADADGDGTATVDIGAVEATPIIVTTAADQFDTPSGAQTSLREAVRDGGAAGARIFFDPAVFDAVPQTITLASELGVTSIVSIDASNLVSGVTIRSGGATRLFRVVIGGNLTLNGLRLIGGSLDLNAFSTQGGAILNNRGALTITNCSVSGSSAAIGGAICILQGALSISHSTVSGNAGALGGGIYIETSPINGPITTSATLTLCTLAGNSALLGGGAIHCDSGRTTLTDCTVSGNTGPAGGGGGVASTSDDRTETVVRNSIVAGNANGDVDLVNLNGGDIATNTFASQGSNLIGTGNATGKFTQPADSSGHTAAEIKLAPLGNYGGPTQTMIPLPGSPAVDPAGAPLTSAFLTDQRGFARVVDGDDNSVDTVDIGAVEVRRMTVTTTADQLDTPAGAAISLREAIRDAAATGDRVFFDHAVFNASPRTITLASEIVVTRNVAVDAGTLTRRVTLSGGGTTRLFQVPVGGELNLRGLTLTGGHATQGGAIRNDGTLTITISTLSGNTASVGGAIRNTGTITLERCTLSGNSATLGGAIHSVGATALALCTLAGNSATTIGGAIHNDSGLTTLTDCTVSGNTAASAGGVSSESEFSNTIVRNSIIAGNTNGDVERLIDSGGDPADNPFSSQGTNFVGTGSGTGAFDRTNHTAASLRLAPLSNNGGPTQTMMLQAYSPAIDAGVAITTTPLTDQRGFARSLGAGLDVGAYESGAGDFTANGLSIFARVPPELIGSGVSFEISTNPNFVTQAVTSTLAGTGLYGFAEGPRSSAQFFYPTGVAQDSLGNIFVADAGNNRIRMLTPAGSVTTIAGSGNYALANGPGPEAAFAFPSALAVGPDDNVYVSDTYNHRLCKLTRPESEGLAWTVATLAGTGAAGFADGAGTGAAFNYPYGLDLDAGGNVYVADALNHRIRKVTPDGVVSTFAGAGIAGFLDSPTPTLAQLNTPQGLVIVGNSIFVADRLNHRIRKIAASGAVTTFAGSGTVGLVNDANGPLARFNSPSNLAADVDGNLFVADEQNHSIRKVTPSGVVLTVAGLGSPGFLDGSVFARFNAPSGLVVTFEGTLIVADTENHRLRSVTVRPLTVAATADPDDVNGSGEQVRAVLNVAGLGLTPNATYYFRYRLANGSTESLLGQSFVVSDLPTVVTENASFVTPSEALLNATVDPRNHDTTVRFEYSTDPNLLPPYDVRLLAGSGVPGFSNDTGAAAQFSNPSGIAADGNGNVFVADRLNHRIRRIDATGVVTTFTGSGVAGFASGGSDVAQFDHPAGIAVDPAGILYVADEWNHRIRKITPGGVVTSPAMGSGQAGFADGAIAEARFLFPTGAALDAAGAIYVADRGNHRIRKISPAGIVTTLAGSGSQGFADGAVATAEFNSPQAVAVNAAGDVLVADTGNHRIRVIRGSSVFTLAGGATAGFLNGPGGDALLASPSGIAVDAGGATYVADTGNHRVRRIAPDGQVSTFAGSGVPGTVDSPVTGLYPPTTTQFNLPTAIAIDSTGKLFVAQEGMVRKLTRVARAINVTPDATGIGPRVLSADIPEPLLPGTTYYFRTTGTHEFGTTFGRILSFETPETAVEVFAGDSVDSPPVLHGQSSPVDFGTTPVGAPVTRAFTISNATGVPFAVLAVAVPPGYHVTGGIGFIPAGGTRTLGVTLDAALAGTLGGDLTITSTASGLPTFTFPITGLVLDRPLASILPADAISGQAATLNVMMNPRGSSTTVWFEWSRDPQFDGVIVSTVAGSAPGYANGAGAAAQFAALTGAAADAAGNVYVADGPNHRIRKIAPNGVVSTFAGTGVAGFADGPATSAQFRQPWGVVLGAGGVLFVTDSGNHRIRKITPSGVVSSYSGLGSPGFTDGVASAARFSAPRGLAVDTAGRLYVADHLNHRVRKVALDGSVSTLSGTGTDGFLDGAGSEAQFHFPVGIAVDSAGFVYVTDQGHGIRRVSPGGFTTAFAGSSATPGFLDDNGNAARFASPGGLAPGVDGTLYVADEGNNRIRRVAADRTVTTYAGSGTAGTADGLGEVAQFAAPNGLGVAPDGSVIVGDLGHSTLRKIVPAEHRAQAATGLAGTVGLSVALPVTDLTPGTKWYYRAIATNGGGTTVSTTLSFVTPSAGTPFHAWQVEQFGPEAGNPLVAGPDANPSRDGVSNLVKYALRLNPLVAITGGLPVRGINGGVVTLTYTEVLAATDVDYIVEWSTNLAGWTPTAVTKTTVSENRLTRQVRATFASVGFDRYFVRLRIAFK